MAAVHSGARQRPIGISILAVLAIITGVLNLLFALALMGVGTFGVTFGILAPPEEFVPRSGQPLDRMAVLWQALGFMLDALGYFVGAALNLLFGVGAWGLRPWAWWAGLLANALPVLGALLSAAQGQQTLNGALWSVLLNLLILGYLLTNGVRRAFGQAV
jgi:hypothetical protein